jgi:hypothetical protein
MQQEPHLVVEVCYDLRLFHMRKNLLKVIGSLLGVRDRVHVWAWCAGATARSQEKSRPKLVEWRMKGKHVHYK